MYILDINLGHKVTDPFLDGSYRYRNVFKSIIRRMHSCVLNKREDYMKLLQEKGFTKTTVERAFNRIAIFKNAERKSGKKRLGMNMIKQATEERSVYTYVLKDALTSMLLNWGAKDLGRLAERNLAIYKSVCTGYCNSINELLKSD